MKPPKKQLGNSEPFPVTNMLVHLINREQIGFGEQLWDNSKKFLITKFDKQTNSEIGKK